MLRISAFGKVVSGVVFCGMFVILTQSIACGPTIEFERRLQNTQGGGEQSAGGAPTIENGGGSSPAQGGMGGQGAGGAEYIDIASNSPCECILAYGGPSLGEVELMRLRDEGIPTCFHDDGSMAQYMEQGCLPTPIGQYAGNGRDLEVYYYCTDVCPVSGYMSIRYSGIHDETACCALGGIPRTDWDFEGCIPPELAPWVSPDEACP